MERAFRAFLSARNILPVQRERSVGPMGQLQGRSGTKATFNWYLTRGRFTTKGFNEPGRLSGSLYRHRILNSECNERARLFDQRDRWLPIHTTESEKSSWNRDIGDASWVLGKFVLEILEKLWDGIKYTLMFREFSLDIGWKVGLDCLDCKCALVALIYSVKKKGEGEGRVLYKV